MRSLLLVFPWVLLGCSSQPVVTPSPLPTIEVTGKVQRVCIECSEVTLVPGGYILWDVVTVRIDAPERFGGTTLSVEVMVDGDGSAQREIYPEDSHVTFETNQAALDEGRFMLRASDLVMSNYSKRTP
jgi:hypothetical protein